MSSSTLTTPQALNPPVSSFSQAMRHTFIIARRVLSQLRGDRRFLGLSLVAPMVLIYFLKIFFDGMAIPPRLVSSLIVPIGAFVVFFLTYILCSIGLVRERVTETLSRMFINGFRRTEIIMGYLLAFTLLATVQSLIVLLELGWFFNFDYSFGVQASIYLVIWLLAVFSIALGILLSNFARNEGQVLPTIPLVIVPTIFFSGMIVPVEKLPEWAQWLSRITPLYYANNVLQKLIKPNGSLGEDWANLLGLVIYGAVVLVLASLTLKERD